METESKQRRRAHRSRTLLVLLLAASVLGGAPANPVLSGPTPAVASQAGTGGGGP